MDGFYSFLFYGLIAVGAVLIISLTVLRIDWARHPEKYEKDVENYEKEQYWKKKRQDKEAAIKKAKEKEKKEVLFFKCDCGICLLPIPLNSSNLEETLCDKWVLSTSVCVARSPVDFCYATTEAERRPLVVSVPLLLRSSTNESAHESQTFLLSCRSSKPLPS